MLRPLLSVSIPARNAAAHLGEQLSALAAQEYEGDWEVVVVDNGSTDETSQLARSFHDRLPHVRVVAEPRKGIGHARNAGVASSKGDWLGFLDADDVVAPGWLSAMSTALSEHSFVAGAVEPLTPDDSGYQRIDPFARADMDGPQPALGFLPFAPTGNMALYKTAFEKVGGFRRLTGSGSDIELSWRLQLAGNGLHFARDAVLYYRYRTTQWKTIRQTAFYAAAHPYLYREFRDQGMPRRSRTEVGREVRRLATRVVRLPSMSQQRRQAWLVDVANLLGRARGSVRYRTLYL